MSLQKLINLSEAKLAEISKFGEVLFSPEEVECVMEIPNLAIVIKREGHPAYRAYQKGRLMTIYKVRKNVIEMAENGSSPAQKDVEKLIKDYEFKQVAKA